MPKVCFNIPVIRYQENSRRNSIIYKGLDFIDSFFSWSGNGYQVVSKGLKGKKIIELSKKAYRSSFFEKTMKAALYLTVIAPIMIIFFKLIYRKICQFELLYKFDKDLSKYSLNMSNIALRPHPIPIPDPKPDTDILMLYGMAQSLELDAESQANILSLCGLESNENDQSLHTPQRQDLKQNLEELKIYLKAIVEELSKTELGEKVRKDSLLSLGKDCSAGICHVGNKQKVRKIFHKLHGVDSSDIKEIVLNEIDDLKLEILNQIAYEEMLEDDYPLHSHFISAFQVSLGVALGLDYKEGLKDDFRNGRTVAEFFKSNSNILKRKRRFLEIYTPSVIVNFLYKSLNAKKDDYGVILKISNYYKFISEHLKNNGYGLPKNLKNLRKGPLKKYVDEALKAVKDQSDLKSIYEVAFNEFINEKFFYFDHDQCVPIKLKKEACIFMLEMIGILK